MPRKLTNLEKFYISGNRDQPAVEIAAELPGVGVKTVQKHLQSLDREVNVRVPQEEKIVQAHEETSKPDEETVREINKIEDPEERKKALAALDIKAGEFMGRPRDQFGNVKENSGVVVMTEAASEVSDANKKELRKLQSAKIHSENNRNRIHKIKPGKKTQ
jgi:hypothetical protein